MRYLFAVIMLSTLLAACNKKVASKQTIADQTEAVKPAGVFGDQINAKDAISLVDLVQKMEDTDSMAVKVKGTVEAVCQKKGCWMNIVSNETDKSIFVKFKDYGFFVPLDIAGREVIMDGYAYKEVTSVEELRHYAEDAGKSAAEIAAIDMPEEAFKFMASGVILVEEGK
ncbi:MAG: DUF4920 domain-containing protein [Bacteroidota bacterium]